jgi:flavin reductase (DIM6/NTAB) family NADH-FMN oxidoreductase RutF
MPPTEGLAPDLAGAPTTESPGPDLAGAPTTEGLAPDLAGGPATEGLAPDVAGALASWATAVTLLTVADDRDDVGVTVSAFCAVSADPPLVGVSLMADSYPAELFGRAEEPVTRFAVTLLAAGQRVLAGRFAAEGRPGARLLLDDVPHRRGPDSGALIVDGGLAALECVAAQVITAGDHLLVIAQVTGVPYVADAGEPLIRFRRHYLPARL